MIIKIKKIQHSIRIQEYLSEIQLKGRNKKYEESIQLIQDSANRITRGKKEKYREEYYQGNHIKENSPELKRNESMQTERIL